MARYTSHSFLFPAGKSLGSLADEDIVLVADASDSNAPLDVTVADLSTKVRGDISTSDYVEADLPLSTIVNASDLTYDPAQLFGGTGATTNIATWQAVTDGSFTITIDDTEYDITGLDFSTVTDMIDVSAIIQAGIRAATSAEENVLFNVDQFVIMSADTTIGSYVSKASAQGAGTDISGAGATAFMDCDAGAANEYLVPPKYNVAAADANKIIVLDEAVTVNGTGIRVILPAAAANFRLQVVNLHSGPKLLEITCESGDVVRIGGVISDGELLIYSQTQYDSADIVALDDTTYFAVSSNGTWVQG